MIDTTSIDITKAKKLLIAKEITAKELTEHFIREIEKTNKLNCFITKTFEIALKMASDSDQKFLKNENVGILEGIPIGMKDLFCTNGVRTTAGSNILNNFIPPNESTVTQSMWDEGAILLGKLNCDEFAMGSSNETSFFGNVQNPIGENLVPGGSSGGSSAALAANLTPVTIGTDTGGSIRQPASFTGTVGLKPTYGSCSRATSVSWF